MKAQIPIRYPSDMITFYMTSVFGYLAK